MFSISPFAEGRPIIGRLSESNIRCGMMALADHSTKGSDVIFVLGLMLICILNDALLEKVFIVALLDEIVRRLHHQKIRVKGELVEDSSVSSSASLSVPSFASSSSSVQYLNHNTKWFRLMVGNSASFAETYVNSRGSYLDLSLCTIVYPAAKIVATALLLLLWRLLLVKSKPLWL